MSWNRKEITRERSNELIKQYVKIKPHITVEGYYNQLTESAERNGVVIFSIDYVESLYMLKPGCEVSYSFSIGKESDFSIYPLVGLGYNIARNYRSSNFLTSESNTFLRRMLSL